MLRSMYLARMRASTSSREKPSAVWVRSFVPNEKKSACSAIRSATKQARGSSIIVPTAARAPRLHGLGRHAVDEPAHQLELLLVGHERDHDLEVRRLPVALHGAGGAHDRAHLHLVDLGMEDAEPHAARAEHGVGLRQRVHALERVLELLEVVALLDARALHLLRQVLRIREELVERRVEQADGHRQPPHLLEQALEVLLLERQQVVERRARAPPRSRP